jgi:hypothetical protein
MEGLVILALVFGGTALLIYKARGKAGGVDPRHRIPSRPVSPGGHGLSGIWAAPGNDRSDPGDGGAGPSAS